MRTIHLRVRDIETESRRDLEVHLGDHGVSFSFGELPNEGRYPINVYVIDGVPTVTIYEDISRDLPSHRISLQNLVSCP